MQFKNFIIGSEFYCLCSSSEKTYFTKARNYGDNYKHEVHHHRKWVNDVLEYFAEHMMITKGQAIQMIVSGNILAGKNIHKRAAAKTDDQSLKQQLLDLENLGPSEYMARARNIFSTAIGIRHPLKIVSDRGTGEAKTTNKNVQEATSLRVYGKITKEISSR